ncbi:MAG: hypothetical protein JSS42_13180 [Proteobacteria bacterium]|uniref:hypothetical protein n=1 Tax=Rudaea sp. TaxID=2136325 RepID=UPI00322098EF|nr:hypothetical protein [Pseudomonadota bacterium]
MRRIIRCLLPGLVVGLLPLDVFACSACGCTLSSDWGSQGLVTSKGWRFDARFDFFDQDQLREGTSSVARAGLAIPNAREVQQYTTNRNYTFALDYSPGKDWGVSVALPWFNRSHGTIVAGDEAVSTSHDQGIGDLRVLARYSGFDAQRATGIEFGLKLPTGTFASKFETGPQEGETIDRGLQLGTGTTDLLLGAYHFGAFNADWGYFGQALLQLPLNSREDFKSGAGLNLNAGLRYTASETFVPQLQVNARIEKRERGANADVDNSGATLIYLSPGVTWNFSHRFSAYAFAQMPLHQRVNGLQIETRWSGSVGLHYIF